MIELNNRMTYRQLSKWLSSNKGQWKRRNFKDCHTHASYTEDNDNLEVSKDIIIRPWNSNEWIEPTLDIYRRDCNDY